MAVEFILGRSGSGKSRRCIDSIIGELAGAGDELQCILVTDHDVVKFSPEKQGNLERNWCQTSIFRLDAS